MVKLRTTHKLVISPIYIPIGWLQNIFKLYNYFLKYIQFCLSPYSKIISHLCWKIWRFGGNFGASLLATTVMQGKVGVEWNITVRFKRLLYINVVCSYFRFEIIVWERIWYESRKHQREKWSLIDEILHFSIKLYLEDCILIFLSTHYWNCVLKGEINMRFQLRTI